MRPIQPGAVGGAVGCGIRNCSSSASCPRAIMGECVGVSPRRSALLAPPHNMVTRAATLCNNRQSGRPPNTRPHEALG